MFAAVLVANRGEVAVRIIRTLDRMGIRSVAVHSDSDADALHVRLAAAAVRIGPEPAAESYLRADRIIEAAADAGAEAIHPGYGFLSESAGFASECAAAGLVFIGPPAAAIAAMGDKIQAKRTAERAGVAVVPGTQADQMSDDELIAAASGVGFPLLIKPAAGGGGKGMRAVSGAAELPEAIAGARREARAAFADDRMLLEALIPRPRHLEIQILADTRGAAVHLGERECSLQRRHQKIVEECPSPLADAALRQRMGTAALDVARACDYVSAGTVEFIVPHDAPESFYFLEMNTRLQVEHPVTEAVYGVDLVEQQLLIAAGEPLAFDQADLRPSGHAIEARVYAEDPARGFLPTGGRVLDLVEPAGEGIRVDSGIVQSDTVTSAYDPLLMKVIAHAETRGGALRRLDEALSSTLILGLGTNTGFVRDLLAHPDVVAGKLDTGLVERDLSQRSETGVPPDVQVTAALARLLDLEPESGELAGPFDLPGGWRLGGEPAWLSLRFSAEGSEPSVVRVRGRADAADAEVADRPRIRASAARQPDGWLRVSLDGQERRYRCVSAGRVLWLGRDGRAWALREQDRLARTVEEAASAGEIISPMPGSVIAVHVAPGQSVEAGKPLIVVEAMKMEHVLTAPIDGVVAKLLVDVGDRVRLAQPLAVVEEQR